MCSHKNANMNTRAELNGKSNSVVVVVIVAHIKRSEKLTRFVRLKWLGILWLVVEIATAHAFHVTTYSTFKVQSKKNWLLAFAGFRRKMCQPFVVVALNKYPITASKWWWCVTRHHQMRWHSILICGRKRSSILISIYSKVREPFCGQRATAAAIRFHKIYFASNNRICTQAQEL